MFRTSLWHIPRRAYKVSVILITGAPNAGKTAVAAALLSRLRDAGRTAAYYKPHSPTPANDPDHQFAAGALNASLGIAVGPPPQPPSGDAANAAATIAELRRRHDTIIVEAAPDAPAAELADAADARILEIQTYPPDHRAPARWGPRLAGVIVNAAPVYRIQAAQEAAGPNAVVIPESRLMLAPTVAQIGETLDAVWTLDPVNADALVERYLIGGNLLDNGPTYYGRYANQAVITRAQRPDIQLACMLPQTRCLLLTGPGEPTEYIKAEARERDIPLLQVAASTIAAADALERLMSAATARHLAKVRHYAALLERHAGAERLAAWLE